MTYIKCLRSNVIDKLLDRLIISNIAVFTILIDIGRQQYKLGTKHDKHKRIELFLVFAYNVL